MVQAVYEMIDEDLIPVAISDRDAATENDWGTSAAESKTVLKSIACSITCHERPNQVSVDDAVVIIADEDDSGTVSRMPTSAPVTAVGNATRIQRRSIEQIVT